MCVVAMVRPHPLNIDVYKRRNIILVVIIIIAGWGLLLQGRWAKPWTLNPKPANLHCPGLSAAVAGFWFRAQGFDSGMMELKITIAVRDFSGINIYHSLPSANK